MEYCLRRNVMNLLISFPRWRRTVSCTSGASGFKKKWRADKLPAHQIQNCSPKKIYTGNGLSNLSFEF